jgi:D-glycero-D-manno-heptose 1,7-bisphosphate phosphatase
MTAGRVGVFLDRDGTIIEDRDYPGDPEQVRLLPGAAAAIRRLNEAGLPVVVITNQSGIARGLITEEKYAAVRQRMEELLAAEGASLTATYHCPHGPDTVPPCECRKPAPGMFERGARDHGLSMARSFFVGDRPRDVLAGAAAGGTGFLIRSPAAAGLPPGTPRVSLVSDLAEAVETLLASGPFD